MPCSLMQKTVLIGSLAATCIALPVPANAESQVILRGTFEGRSDHTVTGGITILNVDSGAIVVLEPNFLLDGAPDPKLGFGKNGYDASTQFTILESNAGVQVYAIPESIDPTEFNEFWVWCDQFDVPLGVATLN